MLGVLIAKRVAEIDGHLPAEAIEVGAHVAEEVVAGHDVVFVAQLSLDDEGAAVARALMDIGKRASCSGTWVDLVHPSVCTVYFDRHA